MTMTVYILQYYLRTEGNWFETNGESFKEIRFAIIDHLSPIYVINVRVVRLSLESWWRQPTLSACLRRSLVTQSSHESSCWYSASTLDPSHFTATDAYIYVLIITSGLLTPPSRTHSHHGIHGNSPMYVLEM